jgi:hypothetical protein
MDAQRKPPIILFVLILFVLAPFSFARAGAAPAGVETRLIDGGEQMRVRYAGLLIRLPGDALTYWRDPGDAGVSPAFDFSGSENLVSAVALYPLPSRFDEAGAQAIGYKHEVVFPLRLTVKDPSRPIGLAVAVDFAMCEKLCLPIHAALRLDLPPRGQAAPGFAEFLARAPRVLTDVEAAEVARISRVSGDGAPQWLLRLKQPAPDIFVEAPEGFHVDSRKEGDGFRLTLDQRPEAGALPGPLRLTVAGEAPVEFSMSLK